MIEIVLSIALLGGVTQKAEPVQKAHQKAAVHQKGPVQKGRAWHQRAHKRTGWLFFRWRNCRC